MRISKAGVNKFPPPTDVGGYEDYEHNVAAHVSAWMIDHMSPIPIDKTHDHLPRLPGAFYSGLAMVHWTLTMKDRQTGWLSELYHARFREILVHACGRYHILCPVYCIMPDHVHVLWVGVRQSANQLNAMKLFKQELNRISLTATLQKQSYDNVLRESDREKNAFQAISHYILSNPVRAGLVLQVSEWPYSGTLVPGYPNVSPHQNGFWDLFWRLYVLKQESGEPPTDVGGYEDIENIT